jgi:muconolactone delta-isomerase
MNTINDDPATVPLPGQAAADRVTAFLDAWAEEREGHAKVLHVARGHGSYQMLTVADLHAVLADRERLAAQLAERPHYVYMTDEALTEAEYAELRERFVAAQKTEPIRVLPAGQPAEAPDEPKQPTADTVMSPQQWCDVYGVRIIDPDGWRSRDAPPWDQPITLVEFARRARICTTDAANPAWSGVSRDAAALKEQDHG